MLRSSQVLRGLSYRSKFIRDLTYSPQVLNLLSSCCGEHVHPSDICMNNPQINFGEIGEEKPVDIWHLDSVPYVMVILLSDAEGMVGGELEVRVCEERKARVCTRSEAAKRCDMHRRLVSLMTNAIPTSQTIPFFATRFACRR